MNNFPPRTLNEWNALSMSLAKWRLWNVLNQLLEPMLCLFDDCLFVSVAIIYLFTYLFIYLL